MSELKTIIQDVRAFQSTGMHDEAIALLKGAEIIAESISDKIEIYKLLCFNLRKTDQMSLALVYINKAINYAKKQMEMCSISDNIMEYAICLMNRGVIYDALKSYNKAIDSYYIASNHLINLYENNEFEGGIIINSLINLGMAYYENGQIYEARNTLEKALSYFSTNYENDIRYISIINTLNELN